MTERKTYLGDSAYADYDGYNIVLTTEDGIDVTNTIYLEPSVWKHLTDWVERLNPKEGPNDS